MELELPLCPPCQARVPKARIYSRFTMHPRQAHTPCADCGNPTACRIVIVHPSSATMDILNQLDGVVEVLIRALQLPHDSEAHPDDRAIGDPTPHPDAPEENHP